MKRTKRNMRWVGYLGAGVAGFLAARSIYRKVTAYDFKNRSVVIAGGSRGLALVLARQLAAEGAKITLLARDQAELESAEAELKSTGAEVMVWPCDIRDQKQVEETLGRVVRNFGRIDVLINNAGIIQVGPVEQMTVQDFRDAMEVHFWGPLYTILASRHYMQQQGGGRIANITSIGGKISVPHLGPYTASKFALVGLSDGMRAELAKDNILITTIVPGLMRTGSHVNARFKGRYKNEYAWFSSFDANPLASTSAESAARQIVDAIRHGDPHLTITPQARILELANTVAPGLVARGMRFMNRFLPKPAPEQGYESRSGWESWSDASPSILTQPADKEISKNNQDVRFEEEKRVNL
ncbi:MAG: SDR family NAD(P)-dependent oxidoreductase [Chloroflexi bacterium]|nr:MAG: SDR family NAD(P)-dependent oxidoreductase [Chloroflexota bacterium]